MTDTETRRGDNELLRGPETAQPQAGQWCQPGWLWLQRALLALVKGRIVTLLWGQRPRHRVRGQTERQRKRRLSWREGDTERRQKSREKKRPKIEKETQRNSSEDTEAGLGWGEAGNRRHSGRGSLRWTRPCEAGGVGAAPGPLEKVSEPAFDQPPGFSGGRTGGWAISPRLAPG